MSQLLSIYEHQAVAYEWSEDDVASLERLRRTAGADILRAVVSRGRKCLQAAQYVGVVRLGQRCFQILPKIYRADATSTERARQATGNLLHMLQAAGQVLVREHSFAGLLRRDLDWFEVLTRLFATHLSEEWDRGAFRAYEAIDDEQPVLRGSWRVAHQLRRPERKHILAITYDEFTPNTPLNRLLRFVVERLWLVTRDAKNRRLLGELRCRMTDVALPPTFSPEAADGIVLTRLSQRYAPVLNLARLFLRSSSLQLTFGTVQTFAFVFDMNRLFEQFVSETVRRQLRSTWEPRGWSLRTQSAGRALVCDEAGQKQFWLRPDLLIEDAEGRIVLVLDTKYKRVDMAAAQAGVAEADAYQMFAYARRYDCSRVVLLYPTADEPFVVLDPRPSIRRFRMPGEGNAWLEVRTLNLASDLNSRAERAALYRELASVLLGQEEPTP